MIPRQPSRCVLRSVLSVKPTRLTRAFSVSGSLNNDRSSSPKDLSPDEILKMGFEKLSNKNHKKSTEELNSLMDAGKKLKIPSSEIKRVYDNVEPGSGDYGQLNAYQKSQVAQVDAAMFGPTANVDDTFPVFNYDDLPTLGHLQLREHRIQREYNRIAAYDLPQLTKYAQPYKPAVKNKDVLEFRYTVYLGEEDHPGSSKVVVMFKPDDLGLSAKQKHKLCLLAGTRYDPTRNEIRISSSKFAVQSQNKRYLADVVSDLLSAAKDETDLFEDVPLDDRHIRARTQRLKKRYPHFEFPEEWKNPEDAPKKRVDFESRLLELAKPL